MVVKFVLFAKLKKVLIIFTTNIENVNSVIIKEVQDVTMKTKINYQINENYIMKKVEISYLQSLKQTNKTETMKEKYINNKYKNFVKSYKI